MPLQHLRSSTAHKRPIPTVMSAGQIAINTNEASPALFFKDSNGDLVKVGPIHIGTSAPNSSPASVAATALVTGTVYQILTVGTSDFTLVGASANTVGTIFTATGTTTGTGTVSGQQGVEKGEMWLDTTGGTYVLKIYDGTDWRSESGTFVDVSGDTMTGDLVMNNANIVFEGATADDFETILTVVDPTADNTITLPDVSGDIVTTGDTGTVTSTMIADGTIVNADVNASAAIAGTKIDPDFGSQTVETTGVFSAAGGAAATPSIAFTGDLNTGISSANADELTISTGGIARITASGIPGSDESFTMKLHGENMFSTNFELTNSAGTPIVSLGNGINGKFIELNTGVSGATDGTIRVENSGSIRIKGNDVNNGGALRLGVFGSSSCLAFEGSRTGSSGWDAGRIDVFSGAGSTEISWMKFALTDQGKLASANYFYLAQNLGSAPNDNTLLATAESTDFAVGIDRNGTGISTYRTSAPIFLGADGDAYFSGSVGLGTTSPDAPLHIDNPDDTSITQIIETGNAQVSLVLRNSTSTGNNIQLNAIANDFRILTNAEERMRIDSSGRLLVGTSTGVTGTLGVFPANISRIQILGNSTNDAGGGSLVLGRKENTASVSDDDALGQIIFTDAQAGQYASINAWIDSTPGSSDYPGRLVFSTTADGASSPTERMTIYQTGQVLIAHSTNSTRVLRVDSDSTTFDDATIQTSCDRSASSAYNFFKALSSGGADIEFLLKGNGNAVADGSWSGGGADYAEYFEWSDGNTASEDRRGISVVLDGDKIREAAAGEEPIGVISGNPSVVGDADIDRWKGKYLRDDFGTYIQEDYEVEDNNDNTVIQQRRKLNPDYNPNLEYISREDRPEWDCVGLMGKLRIRKGQVTGSRWIKMRDISDSVEEWLVR